MNSQIIIGLLLTILPISELRGGLPLIVDYAKTNNVSIWPYFAIVIMLNIAVIFFIFLFLDVLHEYFMNIKLYRKLMLRYIEKSRIKGEKLIEKMDRLGYIALAIFVAIPIPGTGAWTGSLVAWLFKLNRKKSILAISIGVVIAGLIMLGLSLGFLNFFS